MVLLVTTLLSLVTMFDTVRNNSPDALELKSIEVNIWPSKRFCLLSVTGYVCVSLGLVVMLHVLRISCADGIFCRPFRDPLRFTLEKITICSPRSSTSTRSSTAFTSPNNYNKSTLDSKSHGSDDHPEFTKCRNASKNLFHRLESRPEFDIFRFHFVIISIGTFTFII